MWQILWKVTLMKIAKIMAGVKMVKLMLMLIVIIMMKKAHYGKFFYVQFHKNVQFYKKLVQF